VKPRIAGNGASHDCSNNQGCPTAKVWATWMKAYCLKKSCHRADQNRPVPGRIDPASQFA
jgi:hypothetical protein